MVLTSDLCPLSSCLLPPAVCLLLSAYCRLLFTHPLKLRSLTQPLPKGEEQKQVVLTASRLLILRPFRARRIIRRGGARVLAYPWLISFTPSA